MGLLLGRRLGLGTVLLESLPSLEGPFQERVWLCSAILRGMSWHVGVAVPSLLMRRDRCEI